MRIKVTLAAMAMGMLAFPAAAVAQDFDKAEFTAQELAPGLSMLSGIGGNLALFTGADGSVLVDTEYPQLAGKLDAKLASMNAKPVRYVVNTHWHFDHVGANAALAAGGATIIAHEKARARMATGGMVLGNMTQPVPDEALPRLTFSEGLTFHANGDTIDLVYTGAGHTDGDIAVYWRKANVLHTGDLMMHQMGLPFIDLDSGGDADRLVASLDRLVGLTNADTKVIPGHGPLATQADLVLWRDRVKAAVGAVRRLSAEGRDTDSIKADPALEVLVEQGGFISADLFITNVLNSPGEGGDKP